MADINCDLTRFEIYEEDLNVPLEVAAKQRRQLQQHMVKLPALFVTGSMDQVNEKLQHLSGTIQAHPAALIFEIRVSKCDILPRVQSEKTMQNIFDIQTENRPKSKVAKPKLVELQRYPGFNPLEPTPLPNETALDQILYNVLKARSQGKKQTGYIADFKQLLNSTLMKNILLDCFWWFFLHIQQPQSSVQCQLFDRVSKNYVLLIMECWNWAFGDRFLQKSARLRTRALWKATKTSISYLTWLRALASSEESSSEQQAGKTCPVEEMPHFNASGPTVKYGISSVPLQTEPPVARRGPDFMKNLFNVFGFSPLVLNFLQRLKLEPHAGENVFMTRTEIQRLPPYPSIGPFPCGLVLFIAKH
ncbi:protein FAM227A-like isoform X2 [Rhinoraja longicauda]